MQPGGGCAALAREAPRPPLEFGGAATVNSNLPIGVRRGDCQLLPKLFAPLSHIDVEVGSGEGQRPAAGVDIAEPVAKLDLQQAAGMRMDPIEDRRGDELASLVDQTGEIPEWQALDAKPISTLTATAATPSWKPQA
jgi:hypothetical protein